MTALNRIDTTRSGELRAAEAALKAGVLHSAILNSALFSSIATDVQGVIQIFNAGAERMLGYAAADVVDRLTPADLSDPQELADRARALSVELEIGITPGFAALVFKASRGIEDIYELSYIRKDGSRFPAVVSVTALRDAHDAIVGYLLIGTDNTARKQAQAAERHLAAIVESCSDAVVGEDLGGLVTSWNAGAEHLLGYSLEEMIGKPIARLLAPDQPPDESRKLTAIGAGNRPASCDTVYVHKDGSRIDVAQTISPILDAGGRVVGASLVARDVGALRRAEAAVQRLNVELEQRVARRTAELQSANEELEAFAYSVSHDLRAPLRAIDGFSRVLLEDYEASLDTEGKDCLRRVCDAAQRMGLLIDDMLTLSRASRGELLVGPVDLSAIAEAANAELCRANPQRKVSVNIAPGLIGYGDARLLRVVMNNLFSNAWKFTARTVAPRIVFGAEQKDGALVCHLSDNGVGFDPTYAGKLFGPFQRLHSSADFPGNGVGLAIVKRVIVRLGGAVWAKGVVGQGATFWFSLPVQRREGGNT